jgi:UDP-N-acetylglucosamine transferase subunit ALG13
MVFVTVGNSANCFNRLLMAVEHLASSGYFGKEEVIIQKGPCTEFNPVYCRAKDFFSPEEFDELLNQARLVICHGGCTLLNVIKQKKIPVVIPRRQKYGEIINDHQLHFVRTLAEQGLVSPAYEIDELPLAIEKTVDLSSKLTRFDIDRKSPMLNLIDLAVQELTKKYSDL